MGNMAQQSRFVMSHNLTFCIKSETAALLSRFFVSDFERDFRSDPLPLRKNSVCGFNRQFFFSSQIN